MKKGVYIPTIIFTGSLSLLVLGFVYAATFTDSTQTDFDAGTYSDTTWNTDHVELGSDQTSGTYTSQVFDGGESVTVSWDTLSWTETLNSATKLIAIDNDADVWKSTDGGVSWTLVKDDYNGADNNGGLDHAVVDSSGNIFTFHNKDIWKSTDAGVSWSNVNTAYGGGNAKTGAIDSSNNLYIADGNEDIWKSTDAGVSWTEVDTNMNGGNGNVLGMTAVNATLYIVDNDADVWKSTDGGVSWTLVKDDYNAGNNNGGSDAMVSDSSGSLYIARNKDIWKSTDSGVSFTKVNDSYGTKDVKRMNVDSSDHLHIADKDENIWKSTDSGVSFTQNGTNINGGNGDVLGLVPLSISTDITLQVRSGSSNPPTDAFSGSYTVAAGEGISVSDNRFFQYQASFTSGDSTVTPELSAVSIDYTTTEDGDGGDGGDGGDDGGGGDPEPERSSGGAISPNKVSIQGYGYPSSTLEVLRRSVLDAKYVNVPSTERNEVDTDGVFDIYLEALLQGEYLFALRAHDVDGNQTGIISFGTHLRLGSDLIVDELVLPPTLSLEKTTLTESSDLFVSGYASPGADIELIIEEHEHSTTADDLGKYELAIQTNDLSLGDHYIKAKQVISDSLESSYSVDTGFRISALETPEADFNADQVINITDWSIFLFRWGTDDEVLKAKVDMDKNGTVDITDFSIFLKAMKI